MGSGGADGIPALWASSPVSDHARLNGGKDVRTRASALINGELKIDFGPDTLAQIQRCRLDPRDWRAILITHSHDDHLAPREFQYMFPPFVDSGTPVPPVYGGSTVIERIQAELEEGRRPSLYPLETGRTVRVCDYDVTPISAKHSDSEECFNFVIAREKTILYAVDTGYYEEPTWDALQRWKFDGIVIECTEGLNPTEYSGHLAAQDVLDVVGRLRQMGAASNSTVVCTSHHAHTGRATHGELQAFFEPHGITVGYDGLEIRL